MVMMIMMNKRQRLVQQLNLDTVAQTYGHLNQRTHLQIITVSPEHHRGNIQWSIETYGGPHKHSKTSVVLYYL